jgi:hypothetical protein
VAPDHSQVEIEQAKHQAALPSIALPAAPLATVGARALMLQRLVGNRATGAILAREFRIAPSVAAPPPVNLTTAALRKARSWNQVLFTDPKEIATVRDVLGIPREPSVTDDDLSLAVARYQADYGLTADGMLGPKTAGPLAAEMTAEADALGDPARGTELRRVAQRLRLRSMSLRTQGSVTSQGFVGPDDMPSGAVTVRMGDVEKGFGLKNAVSIEYVGADADSVHWLQFISTEQFGTPPGAAAPVFATGTVQTTNGPMTFSDPSTPHWTVDSVPADPTDPDPSPLYDVSGGAARVKAGAQIAMLDEPGEDSNIPGAQAFAASGPAAGSPVVTTRDTFSAYAVKGNRVVYRVDYFVLEDVDIATGKAKPDRYFLKWAGQVTGLRAEHAAALKAKFPGSPIR